MIQRRKRFAIATLGLLLSICFAGCNALESFEGEPDAGDAEERRALLERARYQADQGNCVEARDLIVNVSPKDDEIYFTLGFAQLCVAGATLENIGTTVASYTSSSGNDFTVVGYLARRLLDYSVSKDNEISHAVISFQSIVEPNRRAYATIVGHLTRLAIIVARASGSTGSLTKDSISTNCSSAASCTAAGMTDTDANEFKGEVTSMATDASSIALPGLKDLATALNSSFGGAATADAIRYLVRTNVVPN